MSLANSTMIMSGGSRGTARYNAIDAEEAIEAAGGHALPLVRDIRDD